MTKETRFVPRAAENRELVHPRGMLPGGDLQTLLGCILGARYRSSLPPAYSLFVRVAEQAILRVEITPNPGRPLLVLIHGFTGHAGSPALLRLTNRAFPEGYAVARVNLRNAGDTHDLSKGLFNLYQWNDLHAVFSTLHDKLQSPEMYAVGYSVGGNFLLNYLARNPQPHSELRAAIAVCPPIDVSLAATEVCRPRNRIYANAFMRALNHTIDVKRQLGERYPDPRHRRATTVPEYDRRFVLQELQPGLTPADYYAISSSKPFLRRIEVPTVVLASHNDPLVPARSFDDVDPTSNVKILMSDKGGHLGFLYIRPSGASCWVSDTVLELLGETAGTKHSLRLRKEEWGS